jgi:hypothetical protein
MCHLTYLDGPGSDETTWGEPVSDEDYQLANEM